MERKIERGDWKGASGEKLLTAEFCSISSGTSDGAKVGNQWHGARTWVAILNAAA
jgi:hypothetical protein